jgi:putative ATP-dependent endonuclease of OLD family
MKISHVGVHNFRSIRDLELTVGGMMVLLGPNNHGKSNILLAIEFGLTPGAKVESDDFFAFRAPGADALWVELTFVDLTEQERRTFEKYLRHDGSIKIRKTAQLTTTGGIDVAYKGYRQEPQIWWLQASAFERISSRERVEFEMQTVPELAGLIQGGGRITKQRVEEFQTSYQQQNRDTVASLEQLEESPLFGVRNVAGGVLPDFYLVPAVRDVTDETRAKSSSVFGRLLQRALQEMHEHDDRFLALRDELNKLVGQLNERSEQTATNTSRLTQLESDIAAELLAWNVKVKIQISPPELDFGAEFQLDDGHTSVAERKGHGLQRAVIFALLRSWAKSLQTAPSQSVTAPRRASESLVFAIEEPELYLHPHAQRQLAATLQDIAQAPQHQIFVCSHSTHFVNLDQYRGITIVRKRDASTGTEVCQCTRDLFEGAGTDERKSHFHMAYWVNPDRGELFFARRVILVEGETEKALLPFLATQLGCFDPSVSIIDCGSKHNIPLYLRILNAFGLNYTVIHDEDTSASEHEFNAELASAIDGRLGKLMILSPNFERVTGISPAQAKHKGKALAALSHFAHKTAQQIPVQLSDAVRVAYGT